MYYVECFDRILYGQRTLAKTAIRETDVYLEQICVHQVQSYEILMKGGS